MTTSIDYTGFPHIFLSVLRHCDFATQQRSGYSAPMPRLKSIGHHGSYLHVSVWGDTLRLNSVLLSGDRLWAKPKLVLISGDRLGPKLPFLYP